MSLKPIIVWTGRIAGAAGAHTYRIVRIDDGEGKSTLAFEVLRADAMGAEHWRDIPRLSAADVILRDMITERALLALAKVKP